MTGLILILTVFSGVRTPLLDLYREAVDSWAGGDTETAAVIMMEIAGRMPREPRALYNLAALMTEMGEWALADSILGSLSETGIGEDSLFNARVSAALGHSMELGDYQGVLGQYQLLLPPVALASGDSLTRHNYEVALRWLIENEPPPDREPDDSDQDEDPEEQEQENGQDQPDQDRDDPDQDPGDQDQDSDGEDPRQPPPPPERGEMTPEEARRILDMVDEAEEMVDKDSTGPGVPGTPNW